MVHKSSAFGVCADLVVLAHRQPPYYKYLSDQDGVFHVWGLLGL